VGRLEADAAGADADRHKAAERQLGAQRAAGESKPAAGARGPGEPGGATGATSAATGEMADRGAKAL
jgi:hypothetical protein